MTILIGVMGPAGSGKSTVSDHLVKRYGAVKYSLAGPLKEIARSVLEFTDEQLYGTQAQKEAIDPRYGFSPRWFLQRLGTEGLREHFGEDVWVELMLKKIMRDNPVVAVCEDVRFLNEAIHVLTFGHGGGMHTGHVWKLKPLKRSEADPTHASELGWQTAPYDYAIAPTEYGLEHLHRLVDDACFHHKVFPIRPELPL